MREGPDIARAAALVADPARSAMLLGLMDGRALTASELAGLAGVTRQTASSHLSRLVDGQVLAVEAQGRHRYFRLAGPEVAALLEALMVFSGEGMADSQRAPRTSLRTGPRDPELREARICYDHLAGEMGVQIHDHALAAGWLSADLTMTEAGWQGVGRIGITQADLPRSNRPMCRSCLDWSARRPHLAGRMGQAILTAILAQGWAQRVTDSRVIRFNPEGKRRFADWLH